MNKPILLDLFCGAGGATKGYQDAGFYVVGVDINPQPDYCGDEFIHEDAIGSLGDIWNMWTYYGKPPKYAAIHASPPCQASCALTAGTNQGRRYANLIPETRTLLAELPVPTVIENVQGSDLRRDLTLCGEMFGLGVIRHRYFEVSVPVEKPVHKPHRGKVRGWRHGEYFDGPYVAVYGAGGGKGSVAEWKSAMGIDWTDNRKSVAESIPPSYAEFVGWQLLAHIGSGVAA